MKIRLTRSTRLIALLVVIVLAMFGLLVGRRVTSTYGPISDTDRIKDLYIIQGAVDTYYQAHDSIPKNMEQLHLGDLGSHIHGFRGQVSDFSYMPASDDVSGSDYELCTVFSDTASASDHDSAYFASYHTGKNCFHLDAYQDHVTAGRYNGSFDPRYKGPR